MSIYELISTHTKSDFTCKRIVGDIMNELHGRGGIDNALDDVDDDIMQEIFETLVDMTDNHLKHMVELEVAMREKGLTLGGK